MTDASDVSPSPSASQTQAADAATGASFAGLRRAGAVAVVLVASVAAVLVFAPPWIALATDNLAQTIAPALAALTCATAARRSSGQGRRVWTAMAAGCASWAVGQAIWTVYELGLGRETPFPSIADLGFLGFPIGAGAALWLYPEGGVVGDRRRRMFDGLTITSALALVSWSTALGAVAQAGAENPLAFVIGLAYPASDLLIVAMTLIVLTHTTQDRPVLLLFAGGIAFIAVSDSVFAYLTALEIYGTGGLEGLGWIIGFTLLALAPKARRTDVMTGDEEVRLAAPTAGLLPYLPVAMATVVVLATALSGGTLDVVTWLLGIVVLALVMLRQYVTLRDNGQLMSTLAEREEQLRHQAFHDGLTGLANRALFQDRVDHALALHRRDHRSLAVLFCDLDDFKVINDSLGHAVGDALLVRVAERLRGALRAGDTLARLGGDEFAVLLEDARSPETIAGAMLAALSEPFILSGHSVAVSTSIGVTMVRAGAPTPCASALLAQADTAMYAAKRDGRGLSRAFERGMTLPEVTRSAHRDALSTAIDAGRITLAYQPIVALGSGKVLGVEALARWQHNADAVPPSVFIDVAERTGLIAPLTDLVLDQACQQLIALEQLPGGAELTMSINVSPQQVTDRTFPAHLRCLLARHGVRASRLVVEITESGMLADADAAADVTGELAAMGVRVALDDFGVGYSSLAHLDRITLHDIKIDRSFIAGIGQGTGRDRVTTAMLSLGTALGLHVVAEGVERADQLATLTDLGCEAAQGYLLARPMTSEALVPWLLAHDLVGPPAEPVAPLAGSR